VNNYPVIALSAAQKDGIGLLAEHLKACMGYVASTEGQFMARRRHVTALSEAKAHLDIGYEQLMGHFAGELLAEELRLAQQALNEITGEFTSDDLLGKIFSSFCIGK
jgi:tRNA modification GTPase